MIVFHTVDDPKMGVLELIKLLRHFLAEYELAFKEPSTQIELDVITDTIRNYEARIATIGKSMVVLDDFSKVVAKCFGDARATIDRCATADMIDASRKGSSIYYEAEIQGGQLAIQSLLAEITRLKKIREIKEFKLQNKIQEAADCLLAEQRAVYLLRLWVEENMPGETLEAEEEVSPDTATFQ